MIVKLPFGGGSEAVDLRGLRVRQVHGGAPPGSRRLGDAIGAALDRPVTGAPLAERAQGARTATVIVPDGTRRAELPEVLPAVLERLRRGGLPADRATVLVACGTHPPLPPAALATHLGPLPSDVAVLQHDARDERCLRPVGTLADGLAVRLHRAAVEADLLVTVGTVSHHYFAGFGGGPKMVFPGVAGYTEIQHNHSLVLERAAGAWRRRAGCEAGRLADNLVAQQIAAAAALHPADFSICLVPGSNGAPARVVAGAPEAAFAAAVATVREWYEVPAVEQSGLVVASGGGAPGDGTLIQAHKRLDAAARFVLPGGELLFLAAIDGGDGSAEMAPFVADPRPEVILARLARSWVQYGHTTLRIVEKTAAATVWLRSGYPADRARRLGFRPVADPAEVVNHWRQVRPGETVTVLTGPPVYPRPGSHPAAPTRV